MKLKSVVLFFALTAILASCKKDYTCTAVDETDVEVILNCENCSKSDVEEYESEILAKGYVTADCVKK